MNWKKRLYVALLGCIVIFTFGFIIMYLLDEKIWVTDKQKKDRFRSDSNSAQLMKMPDSFDKHFYTPVAPIKYKAESYKEISLPEGEAINPKVSPDGTIIVFVQKINKKTLSPLLIYA